MQYLADVLLVAGALGAGVYCFVLARRLSSFHDLEKGVGGAVAALSAQVDELNRTMITAKKASDGSGEALEELTDRAEAVSRQLELMMASLHDLQDKPTPYPSDHVSQPVVEDAPAQDGTMFHSARTARRETA